MRQCWEFKNNSEWETVRERVDGWVDRTEGEGGRSHNFLRLTFRGIVRYYLHHHERRGKRGEGRWGWTESPYAGSHYQIHLELNRDSWQRGRNYSCLSALTGRRPYKLVPLPTSAVVVGPPSMSPPQSSSHGARSLDREFDISNSIIITINVGRV